MNNDRPSPCRWDVATATRLVRTRHLRDCNTSGCPGCTPCAERHCQLCNHEHVTVEGRGTDQTCATCLSQVRTHLQAVLAMSTALLGEAISRGLNSEAFALAGPAADPEAWGYRRMSALANRIDPKWLDDQVDMHHPAWVIGTWTRETRDHLNQPTDTRPTLTEAHAYLDSHLTRLAHDPAFAFDELATDIRVCHDHLERVLHLDEQRDTGVPCPTCRRPLQRRYAASGPAGDRWDCPRTGCVHGWTQGEYDAYVYRDYLGNADCLTAAQMLAQYRVTESTLRRWANDGHTDADGTHHPASVKKRGYDGQRRQLYDVADVKRMRDTTEHADVS